MLTDLSCKALIVESKRVNKPIKRSDGLGLFLHAFPNGSAYWYHKYSFNGRPKQISYGHYPTISLGDARLKRAESYKLIKEEIDPLQLREERTIQAAKEIEHAFEKVAREWHTKSINLWSTEHGERILYRLEKFLFPSLGKIPVNKMRRKQLLDAVRKVEKQSRSDAKRCVQHATKIFTHAMDEEYAETNIAVGMEQSLAPQKHSHFASMKIELLPEFLCDLERNDAGLSQDRLDAIELLILTVVRPNELIKSEWSEFDFEKRMWTIPGERMKMRHEHYVPLSWQACKILKKRREENFSIKGVHNKYVFPSRKKPSIPMAHNTICNIIIDMGYQGRHTGHGFRALFMGIAKQELEYEHDIPDRQLAHKPKGNVDRAYDRAEYLKQRIKLMQEYADYIDRQKLAINNPSISKLKIGSDQIAFRQGEYRASMDNYEITINAAAIYSDPFINRKIVLDILGNAC